MFQRFTPEARDLILDAQQHGAALGVPRVQAEHLLLALATAEGPAGDVLRDQGLQPGQVTSWLANDGDQERDPGSDFRERPCSDTDAELLKALGIDLEAIRESIDSSFGPGAFDRARASDRSGPSGRGNEKASRKRSRFDRESKRIIELALREALQLKSRNIGPEHPGLAILDAEASATASILESGGVDVDELRSGWEAVAPA